MAENQDPSISFLIVDSIPRQILDLPLQNVAMQTDKTII